MEAISIHGNVWKKFVSVTLAWMATALLAPAQTLTTLHNFSFDDAALPDSATPTQGRNGNTLKGVSPVSRTASEAAPRDPGAFELANP
jgi:hypothetical protein